MAAGAGLVTAEELLAMPDDGLRYELVNGQLHAMPLLGFEHGRVTAAIGGLLAAHVREHDLGGAVSARTGFLLSQDPDTVRAPDVAFVAKARAEAVGYATKYWPGAPDLAVDVVSPSDTWSEVQEKALAWLAAGTVAVFVLDPRSRTAAVHRAAGTLLFEAHDTLDLDDAVPGLRVSLTGIFG